MVGIPAELQPEAPGVVINDWVRGHSELPDGECLSRKNVTVIGH
jgi:hypothetical protein